MKFKEVIKKLFLIIIYRNFSHIYAAVGLVLMLRYHVIIFLLWNFLMIMGSIIKMPDFKSAKISELSKANFFILLIWLLIVFFQGHLIVNFTSCPIESGEVFFVNQNSLLLLRYYGSEFSNYISYKVFMDTLDLLEIMYRFGVKINVVFY